MNSIIEKTTPEASGDTAADPFEAEMQNYLHNLQGQSDHLKGMETGGYPDHPLGEHPTLWMNSQYRTARCRAIENMRSQPGRINSFRYERRLVYPSFGFLFNRFIIQLVFKLKKHRRPCYPKIAVGELMYLNAPSYILRKFRILLAKVKLTLYFLHRHDI